MAFSIVAKKINIINPYNTAHKLGSRIIDSKTTLEDAGWKVEHRESGHNRTYTFSKVLKDEIPF